MSIGVQQREFCRPFLAPAIIVAASPVLREGLATVLSRGNYHIIAVFSSIYEVPLGNAIDTGEYPCLIVLGMNAELEDCITAIRAVRRQHPSGRLVLVMDGVAPANLPGILDAGVHGCILTPASSEILVKCCDLILLGQSVLPYEAISLLKTEPESGHGVIAGPREPVPELAERFLTDRELQVMRCLVAGETNRAIARRFAISEATVKAHMKSILCKIQVRNRTQVAIWAVDHGLSSDAQHTLLSEAISEGIGGIVKLEAEQ